MRMEAEMSFGSGPLRRRQARQGFPVADRRPGCADEGQWV